MNVMRIGLDKTKFYMNELRNISAEYDLELQITAQEEAIKKALRKLDNLRDDSTSLVKKKKKIEEEMLQNNLNINSRKTDSFRQKQILEMLI